MPQDPESLGTGIGSLLADFIPLLPSGARRAGAARVMAARVGRDPSFLVEHPLKTQLLAMGLGAVGNVYTKGAPVPARVAATIAPLLVVQALRRRELGSIQQDYDTKQRKRLRDLDQDELFDTGLFGGSSRLGAASAYETMRARKYRGFGSLAEAGDAIQLAAGAIHPALYPASIPVISGIDNVAADRLMSKRSAFSDQRESPTIPLYLAAALLSSAGLAGARTWAHRELGDTQPMPLPERSPLLRAVSGGAPLSYSKQDFNNAFFLPPAKSVGEAGQMLGFLEGLQDTETVDPVARAKADMLQVFRPDISRGDKLDRLMRFGAVVTGDKAGAPTVAHEAGHAKIEQTPGILRALQRHVYPHHGWIAPLAGAGSMAAGLASGGTLRGALLGTGIGALAGAGTVGPEIGASYHALKHLKGLGDGKLSAEGRKDLMSALSTYLAATVLPSTLAGAAGGWISGRRRKREEREKNASASNEFLKIFRALGRVRKSGMTGDLADSYMRGLFGRNWVPVRRGFYKAPEIQALGITPHTPAAKVESLLADAFSSARPPITPSGPVATPGQQTFEFFKQSHVALPALIGAKKHSDGGRYGEKNRLLKMELRRDPDAFVVDSDDGKGIVGLTHVPTGFRIHMLKSQVDSSVLKSYYQPTA